MRSHIEKGVMTQIPEKKKGKPKIRPEAPRCPDHPNELAVFRGRCKTCYMSFAKMVERKQTTWEELEKNKMVKKQQPRGRPSKKFTPVG